MIRDKTKPIWAQGVLSSEEATTLMQDTDGAQLQPRVKAELTKLAAQAITFDAMAKKASVELDAVKRKIRALVSEHAGAISMEEKSRYWRVPNLGMQVRLTYPSQTPVMNYDELRKEVGDEVFGLITVPSSYVLSGEGLSEAKLAERVTDSQIAKCIHDPPPRDPSVYIEKLTVPGMAPGGGEQ